MYKEDLALNKLQGFICHKIQSTNQPTDPNLFPVDYRKKKKKFNGFIFLRYLLTVIV